MSHIKGLWKSLPTKLIAWSIMNLCKTKWCWKLWFSYINKKKKKKNQIKIIISACFGPIFDFKLKRKRSRAKPSWKSFSSSSGSSQLGSDSSLIRSSIMGPFWVFNSQLSDPHYCPLLYCTIDRSKPFYLL